MAWLDQLFKIVVEKGASDLHMASRAKPMLRLHGDLEPIAGYPDTTPENMLNYFKEITQPFYWKQFDDLHDTDFGYELNGVGRFRCNLFLDENGPGGAFRVIPEKIKTVEELGLPLSLKKLCYLKKGLILVTGPTGSGKSTTLASLIDHINETRHDHIITIEDPIEFVFHNKNCLVNQRQVHRHTESFKKALRAALREDPDVVLIGEMRDLETIEIALETAETGHLVFATLHTNTAISSVDRMVDQFPAGQQNQIRVMLAATLKAVVAQTLCKKLPTGRIAALEVLIVNPAVAANIREAKTHQLMSAMQVGQADGMKLLNDALLDHVRNKIVDPVEAFLNAVDKKDFYHRLHEAGYKLDLTKLYG